jgi:putative spermidine/putrescine transport system substrate-binding protein
MMSLSRTAALGLLLAATATQVQAQTRTLYVGMNGGNMEKTFTQAVFGPFEQKYNVKIAVVPGGSADILAKAQAAKDKPQMHLMFLDDGVMYRAVGMGLCEKQKPNPNLANLLPVAHIKDDLATGVTISVTGLAYNTKVYAEKGWAPPTSWLDLADPKLKGRVVFQSLPSSTFGLHAFLAFNQIKGGTDANVDPGFKAWPSTIGPNVLEYISNSAKISEMAQTGEAALFPYAHAIHALEEQGCARGIRAAQGRRHRADGGAVRDRQQHRAATGPGTGGLSALAAGASPGAGERQLQPDQYQGPGQRHGRGRAGAHEWLRQGRAGGGLG